MIYETIPEFASDFKKLSKRFKTLKDDFEMLKRVHIEPFHDPAIKLCMHDPVKMEGFCRKNAHSYKVRKFACKALKGRGSNSGLRVIYVYQPELNRITFIEIYFKGDQENENKERLKMFLSRI
jgi:mRNA-degrading endonuclease RelE of RelBE toxin-antitoxin system